MVMAADDIEEKLASNAEEGPVTLSAGLDSDSFLTALEEVAAMIGIAREENPFYKLGFYGQPGSGKSWLGASFPRPLIIDMQEDGVKFVPYTKAKRIKVTSIKQVELVYWYLKLRPHPYKSVVLDTVTSMAEMALTYVMGEDKASFEIQRESQLPSQRLYQRSTRIQGLLFNNFKNLPMHVIYLANEKRQVNEEDLSESGDDMGIPTVFPELSPATRSKFIRLVDVLGRLTVTTVNIKNKEGQEENREVRILSTKTNPEFQAKDRTSLLPTQIANPTFKKLQKYLEQKEENSHD